MFGTSKLAIATFGVLVFSLSPASACVGAITQNNNHVLVNNCLYPVIVRYRGTGGSYGTVTIGQGNYQMLAASVREYIRWQTCNYNEWTRGRCTLN